MPGACSEEIKVAEQHAKLEAIQEIIEDDIAETNPTIEAYDNVAEKRPTYNQLYLDLRAVWATYRNKYVPDKVSEGEFNSEQSEHKFNDTWLSEVKKVYKRVDRAAAKFLKDKTSGSEDAERCSKGVLPQSDVAEEKHKKSSKEVVDREIKRIESESKQVTASIDSAFKALEKNETINANQGVVYSNMRQELMLVIDQKIPLMLSELCNIVGPESMEDYEKTLLDFTAFENTEKVRLYKMYHLIGEKVSESQAVVGSGQPFIAQKKEAVHLRKVDPPKFSGDETDFPEFQRKWLAIVNKANLPEEAEVDRLKDSLPSDAKDLLTGVTKLSKAWSLLEKRYGDKGLIATKLKNELKNVNFEEEIDHERVIALVIKVRSIISKLEAIDGSLALQHDAEFISAIYFQLPDRQKTRWLEFEKSSFSNNWLALVSFLDDSYEKAVQERLLLTSYSPNSKEKKSTDNASILAARVESPQGDSSQKGGKAEGDSSQKGGKSASGGGDKGSNAKREAARKRVGKCPLCNQEHTFKPKFKSTSWPSDRFIQCKKFNDMNSKQRGQTLEKYKSCSRCTSWGHQKSDCTVKLVDCKEMVNGAQCHKDHSKLVCNSGVAYCMAAKVVSDDEIDVTQATLPYMQDIVVNKKSSSRVFWDNGSSRVLVNNEFARENNLKSRPAVVTMKVVGDEKKMKVNLYELDLQDMYGKQHTIWGYGLDQIMEPDEPINLEPIKHLFPHVPAQAFETLPKKRIDILIGLNYNKLHPEGGLGVDSVDNLKALRNRFGCGWVLGGAHKDLKIEQLNFSSMAAFARVAKVSISPCCEVTDLDDPKVILPEGKFSAFKSSVAEELTPEFWEADGLGVLPPRRCSRCRQCAEKGECSEPHIMHDLKEQAELNLIKDNVRLENGEVWVTYPFIKDPKCLQNNRDNVVKMAEGLWKSLKKDGLLSQYNEEIQKYLDRGTFVKLSKEEIDSYDGPRQYISHHGVLKDSVTTPLRVVTNSSVNNHGHTLNSCLPKGPNSLNNMMEIMLRFRCHETGFIFDLSKAYNSMRTGVVEKHLRRFVWRFDENDDWQDYAIDRVHFGDTPAATSLEVSKDKIAEKGKDIDEQASKVIIQDIYVDDGVSGGKDDDVQRMVGEMDADGKYKGGTISKILQLGNFNVKEYLVSSNAITNENEANTIRALPGHFNTTRALPGHFNTTGTSNSENNTTGDENGEISLDPGSAFSCILGFKIRFDYNICRCII